MAASRHSSSTRCAVVGRRAACRNSSVSWASCSDSSKDSTASNGAAPECTNTPTDGSPSITRSRVPARCVTTTSTSGDLPGMCGNPAARITSSRPAQRSALAARTAAATSERDDPTGIGHGTTDTRSPSDSAASPPRASRTSVGVPTTTVASCAAPARRAMTCAAASISTDRTVVLSALARS